MENLREKLEAAILNSEMLEMTRVIVQSIDPDSYMGGQEIQDAVFGLIGMVMNATYPDEVTEDRYVSILLPGESERIWLSMDDWYNLENDIETKLLTS